MKEKNKRKKIMMVVPKNLPNFYDDVVRKLHNLDFYLVSDNKEDIYSSVNGMDAIIGCPRALFSEELIKLASPGLKWVHNPGAGVEHFANSEFLKSGITFTNGRIIQGPECADHAMGLLLSLTRSIAMTLRSEPLSQVARPIELRGKSALVFGGGGIGMNVAERLSAFGVDVSVVDDELVNMASFIRSQHYPDEMPMLVASADIVVCCAPLTPNTYQFFNKKLIKKFKQGSYFINVSRGGLVDLDALVHPLRAGKIAGAGLDVTDPEPLPKGHELLTLPNTVITNHIAGLSEHNRARSKQLIIDNLIRFSQGKSLINIVDKSKGY